MTSRYDFLPCRHAFKASWKLAAESWFSFSISSTGDEPTEMTKWINHITSSLKLPSSRLLETSPRGQRSTELPCRKSACLFSGIDAGKKRTSKMSSQCQHHLDGNHVKKTFLWEKDFARKAKPRTCQSKNHSSNTSFKATRSAKPLSQPDSCTLVFWEETWLEACKEAAENEERLVLLVPDYSLILISGVASDIDWECSFCWSNQTKPLMRSLPFCSLQRLKISKKPAPKTVHQAERWMNAFTGNGPQTFCLARLHFCQAFPV